MTREESNDERRGNNSEASDTFHARGEARDLRTPRLSNLEARENFRFLMNPSIRASLIESLRGLSLVGSAETSSRLRYIIEHEFCARLRSLDAHPDKLVVETAMSFTTSCKKTLDVLRTSDPGQPVVCATDLACELDRSGRDFTLAHAHLVVDLKVDHAAERNRAKSIQANEAVLENLRQIVHNLGSRPIPIRRIQGKSLEDASNTDLLTWVMRKGALKRSARERARDLFNQGRLERLLNDIRETLGKRIE